MPLEDDLAARTSTQQSGFGFQSLGQMKWLIIGGLAIVAILVFYFVRKSTGSSSSSSTSAQQPGSAGTQGNVDPATGYPEGSPADIAALNTYGALGGSPGYGLGGAQNYVEHPGNTIYSQGLAVPSYAVAASSPIGPGNSGATGANAPGSTGAASQAMTTQPTVQPTSAKANHNTNRTYTVKPGDNLSAIAAQIGIAGGWQSLYKLNQHIIGPNPNLIYPGQKLTL
jgi:resuscitation-promoting factor RpfA